MILSCLSAPWQGWELVQCSTLCTIFSCFQGDVLCDIDNCINPWFTQSAGKETAPFPTVGFLIAQWSVIYRHLHWSPLCAGRKINAPRMVFVAQDELLSSVMFLPCPALFQECLHCQEVEGMARWHPEFSVSQPESLSVASPCAKMFMVENTALLTCAVLTGQRTCSWGFFLPKKSFSAWTFSLCISGNNKDISDGIISSRTFETLHFKHILRSWPAVSGLNAVGEEEQTGS